MNWGCVAAVWRTREHLGRTPLFVTLPDDFVLPSPKFYLFHKPYIMTYFHRSHDNNVC